MILMTLIARLGDGLPLSGSIEKDESLSRKIQDYQNQAKSLLKKLDYNSPKRVSVETPPYIFHLMVENQVCYLVLCESSFSRKLAFAFLEELQTEFSMRFGSRVASMTRPYPFIEFEREIEQAKKKYKDARARRNLTNLNTELQDVTRIMVQNIDDVLQRGVALSELDNKATSLSMLSQKYKKDAHYLNLKSTYVKVITGLIFVFVLIIYFYVF